jgi:hypothetical protein
MRPLQQKEKTLRELEEGRRLSAEVREDVVEV